MLDEHSVFELASVSKQFTAMGILLLEQKGNLKLADTLRKFFPELPYNQVTIYQMLTHTSGLPDYISGMMAKWDHHHIAFNKDVIAFMANEKPPVNFAPGKKFEYSNTGYVMLAAIIEKVSGKSYHDFMDKRIFKPLHMHNSTVYNSRRSLKDTVSDYAYGYVYLPGTNKYAMPDTLKNYDFVYYFDGITGDGTINSSTDDLLKWENALLNNELLEKGSQQTMLSYHTLMDTSAQKYYSFGVELGKNEFGNFIAHDGGWPGYRTSIIHYKESGYTIIVLSNNQSYSVEISEAITNLLHNNPVILPYRHQETTIDKNILDNYTGKYLVPQPIEIVKRGDKLYRHLPGAPAENDVELKAELPTKFFYTNRTDVQLEFELDQTGKVIRAFSIVCGLKKEIKKV